MLRLWMHCQFIIFVIEFFTIAAAAAATVAAAFPIAMDDCAVAATAIRAISTF